MNAARPASQQNAPRLPASIAAYLDQLRAALADSDPALVHDALYDAEEYLRSELAEHPGRNEAEVIAAVASSYGAPEEVADIYRDTEVTVQTALRAPPPRRHKSVLGRFFGVAADPRAYAALFYMVLALATGIFYFTWVIAGMALSAGLAVLIIGIPFVILFFGSVRVLSLVEGRLVEVMLGQRMPRRPLYAERGKPWLDRIKDMFTDPRTWSTLLYFVAMLPLGIVYFTVAVTMLSTAAAFVAVPVLVWTGIAEPGVSLHSLNFQGWQLVNFNENIVTTSLPSTAQPLVFLAGILLLFVTLHIARGIGHLHGLIAKALLVRQSTRGD